MPRRSAENAIDWDAVRRQYRLGKQSNKQLAMLFQISASSIGRRADKEGWIVDKAEEVDAVTNSLLIQNASGNANPNATPTQLEIKVAAQTNADKILEHRLALDRLRRLRDKLLDEVEIVTDNRDLFQQLGDLLDQSGPDSNGTWRRDKVNELYRKVVSLTERIENTKRLVEIDERVRRGEREAFGLDRADAAPSPLDEMLKKLANEKIIR